VAERRAEKVLTAAYLATDLAPGKYFDGGNIGLFLRVEPNGKRFWVQRLTVKGKRTEIGLGSFPLIKLADARARATENKRLAVLGGDPLEAKRKAKDALTFSKAMDLFLSKKAAEFGNEKHAKQWHSTLDAYAVPVLGNLAVAAIETRHVLKVLEPIWIEKTETASRLRQRIEAVLSWATVAGHRTGDNPARWKGNLAELLAKPGKVADKGNHPALALADVPRWWKALAQREGMAARALQFLTMTLARSGEVRGMTWGEVDLMAAIWTVPAERMKMGREHRVPLTKEAVALLEALPRMEGCDVVFFAPRGGMLSDMTVSAVMRRMQEADVAAGQSGYLDARSKRPAVPHGLRSTFRGWAAEVGIERDMAEMALAHNVGSAVERAYQRSDMLERRRAMLEIWCGAVRGELSSSVVQMRQA
jgi:integrase